jgi:hypothetical protein
VSQSKALAVLHTLIEAEKAFKRSNEKGCERSRELGWQLLEHAEQAIPTIEPEDLFDAAVAHADRIWAIASPEGVRAVVVAARHAPGQRQGL